MVTNFTRGSALRKLDRVAAARRRRALLAFGVTGNLLALGYFKYAGFLVSTTNAITGADYSVPNIVLPLAISFFTFQQIAYLVDVYRNEAHEYRAIHYALFVTFFPPLIAGPIVHHKEMMPQFDGVATRDATSDLAIGLTIFFIGLFKKVVLADSLAPFSNDVFARAAAGDELSLFVAWGGVLSYTFQLYFDFSGYSDMAIGSARMSWCRISSLRRLHGCTPTCIELRAMTGMRSIGITAPCIRFARPASSLSGTSSIRS